MGGIGSGVTGGKDLRTCIDDTIVFCADRFRKLGLLHPGATVSAFDGPMDAGRQIANFRCQKDHLFIDYKGFETTERIDLNWVKMGRGNWLRASFLCPACSTRSQKLYFHNQRLRCRKCHNLAYDSQCNTPYWREIRKLLKLRPMPSQPLLVMWRFPKYKDSS